MASSSRPCAGHGRRVAASATGVLPLDAVYEILLRVRAKALCRMRAVSRPWRRLLSDPQFAAAHATRCQEPFFIHANGDDAVHESIDIIDLTGQTVKRVHLNEFERVFSIPHDLVFVLSPVRIPQIWWYRLVNPATGAVHQLPKDLAEEHMAQGLHRSDYYDCLILVGQVVSTREYKVLRTLRRKCGRVPELCEVFTLGTSSYGDAWWRGKQQPPPPGSFVTGHWDSVVIDGVIYLNAYRRLDVHKPVVKQNWIISFDLEKEEWGLNMQAPQIIFTDDDVRRIRKQLTLANLNGSLAVVHCSTPDLNIWILKDFQKGIWVKQYSMQVERYHDTCDVHPLLVLGDGRIVVHTERTALLEIYDPRTNTSKKLLSRNCCSPVNIYAGNLLSLGRTDDVPEF